jgi:hypothetical protein
MKVESKPPPTPSPPQWEKPVEEIAVVPESTRPAPAADLSTDEEAKETKAESEAPPAQTPPKKTKTRKLKAKPQEATPK